MSKSTSFFACTVFLSSISVSVAAPLDAPGTVYIDGVPCNRLCQDYMAWSNKVSGRQPGPQSDARPQPMATPPVTPKLRQVKRSEPPKPTPARIATLPNSDPARVAKTKKPGDSAAAKPAPLAATSAPTVPTPPPNPRADTETGTQPPAQMAAVPQTQEPAQAPAPPAPTPSVQQPAESQATPPIVAEPPSDVRKPDASAATDTNAAALAMAKSDETIAIFLVREEIKSVADLSNKKVAIDASQASEVTDIKAALNKTGATNVEISEDTKFALGRVMDGEVPAGIITLATPEEAAQWTGVPGFTVLRLPVVHTKGGRG